VKREEISDRISPMVRKVIESEIKKAVRKLFASEIPFDVSPSDKHGDYASNAAMVIGGLPDGKQVNPMDTAEKIRGKLGKSRELAKLVSKIEIAKPGFLNFYLSEDFFSSTTEIILKDMRK